GGRRGVAVDVGAVPVGVEPVVAAVGHHHDDGEVSDHLVDVVIRPVGVAAAVAVQQVQHRVPAGAAGLVANRQHHVGVHHTVHGPRPEGEVGDARVALHRYR